MLISPVIIFTVPILIFDTIFPTLDCGSYINSSMVISDFSPTVKAVSSNKSICALDCALTTMVSPKYIFEPVVSFSLFWLEISPIPTATIPIISFAITLLEENNKNINDTNVVVILFI